VEIVEGKLNKVDEQYVRLIAKAYMPRLKKNEDFILSIDSGITKEVSVGCRMKNVTCSICGKDMKISSCDHRKGRFYKKNGENSLCHAVLDTPLDAYEWSFVAVPAQPEAGVIKGYVPHLTGGDINMNDIFKELSSGNAVTLTCDQSEALFNTFLELKEKAVMGEVYVKDLKQEIVKFVSMVDPTISSVMRNTVDKLSVDDLKTFRDFYKTKYSGMIPMSPQLGVGKKDVLPSDHTQFKI
jgi:hypothetical protein